MTACRLVAFANGPGGYIYQFDGTGITTVELRAEGFITLPSYNPPDGIIRYYIDPVSEAGSVYAATADTTWHIDLHRGDGFLPLGLFNLFDPPFDPPSSPQGTTMPTSRFLRAPVATRAITGVTTVGGASTTTVSIMADNTIRFNDRNGTVWVVQVPANYTKDFKNRIQPNSKTNDNENALYALVDALIART